MLTDPTVSQIPGAAVLILSLWDIVNVRITKSSNYRDSNYRGYLFEIFKGPENFVRITKSLN